MDANHQARTYDGARRLSPEQARGTRFGRSSLTRRGLDEDEVYAFTNRMAEELSGRDAEIVKLVDENRRLKQAMRDWQSQQIGQQPDRTQEAERVSADTAALMARAQQQIDAQVAQAELYCRQREQEAIQRYDEIVEEARKQARADAERVAHQYRASSGTTYSSDQEQVRRQQVYLTALLHALDALGNHLYATRQAFAGEVQKLSSGQTPAPPEELYRQQAQATQPAPPSQPVPPQDRTGADGRPASQERSPAADPAQHAVRPPEPRPAEAGPEADEPPRSRRRTVYPRGHQPTDDGG